MTAAYTLPFNRIYWRSYHRSDTGKCIGGEEVHIVPRGRKQDTACQCVASMDFSECCHNNYRQARVRYQGPERTKSVLSLIIDSTEVFLQWTIELSLEKGDRRNTAAKPTAAGNRAGLGEKTVLSAVEKAGSEVQWLGLSHVQSAEWRVMKKKAKKGVSSNWLKAWKPTKTFAHYCEPWHAMEELAKVKKKQQHTFCKEK